MEEPQEKMEVREKSRLGLTVAVFVAAGGLAIVAAQMGDVGDNGFAAFGGLLFTIGCASAAWWAPALLFDVLREARRDEPED